MSYAIVVAADEGRGIGADNKLPWRVPRDMAFFERVTSEAPTGLRNAVLMGRKTYESIPTRFRPLKERLNVVITRQRDYSVEPGVRVAHDLQQGLDLLQQEANLHAHYVIGGAEIYAMALRDPACDRALVTRIHGSFACDTHLVEFESDFERVAADGPHQSGDASCTFETWHRRDSI